MSTRVPLGVAHRQVHEAVGGATADDVAVRVGSRVETGQAAQPCRAVRCEIPTSVLFAYTGV